MPSNAPTVSRGSGRAGLGGPRPRKSRRPGQLLAASPLSCGCTGGRCGLPAADSGRGWAWCPFSLQPTGGVGGAEQGTVARGPVPPAAAAGWVSGPRLPRQAYPGPSFSLPPASAWSSRPRGFQLRPRAPGRHLGVPGRRKHGSLPGTMHARTSAPPPAGPGAGQSHLRPSRRQLGTPRIQPRALRGQGPLTLSSDHYLRFGDSDPFNPFPIFSGIDYWQLRSLLRITGSWNRVNTVRGSSSSLSKITKVRPRESGLPKVTLGVSC